MGPGLEKILKKVEQDRVKGQPERALTRLKEAIAEHPREFVLAQEGRNLQCPDTAHRRDLLRRRKRILLPADSR